MGVSMPEKIKPINLQKYIASAGITSRRGAERYIRDGRVRINARKATVTDRVHPDDIVTVDGKRVDMTNTHQYLMLNKPPGYVCSHARFSGEKSIYQLLKIPKDMRLFSVGRLDKHSTGLLILTNDGELTQELTHPSFEHEKEYRVGVDSELEKADLTKLKKGVDIGEGVVSAKKIKQLSPTSFSIVITQGKKRQIRRMVEAIGKKTTSLHRIRIGKLELDTNLAPGQHKKLNAKELRQLRKA